ncbi:hypothetical protein [Kineosporia succinea]|uniref:DUF3727 domain-containing protein n=1 Tax=Kineosporia succinea TaxID=84632 RepID=A0ABT9PE28_9ACTN|nr:hypothetical protein [Kineosporia succinea]MDP9830654.1 hypothetical protein [Kineosporia succinea]
MSTVVIDYTDDWIPADLEADPVLWARETVLLRAGEEDLELPEEEAGLLADVMVPALELARQEDPPPVMLLFLLPQADEPAVCAVTVRGEAVEEDVTLDDVLEELRLPEEMLAEPPLEETVQTVSGAAVHLVQRYRVQEEDGTDSLIQEYEVFVWRLRDPDGDEVAVYLSTSFVDLAEAERRRPDLIELATTLTLGDDED